MSKERARRRAERLSTRERDKAARARSVTRRQRRRGLLRALIPTARRRRTGRLFVRRRRGERIGIVVLPLVAVAAIWYLVPEPALRLVLVALLVITLPAVVVIVLDRRS